MTGSFGQILVAACVLLAATAPCLSARAADDLTDLIERVEKSVVRVNITRRNGGGTGSGFVVAPSTIVTNFHVVEKGVTGEVEFADGKTSRVRGFLAVDPKRDVAILSIDKIERPKLTLFDGTPHKGEHVVALGAPLGLSFSASDGIVSAIRANNEILDGGAGGIGREGMTWIQTTVPISPGNSGGPLVNMQGQVVGINTFSTVGGQNLNFAVSSGDIQSVLDKVTADPQPFAKLPTQSRTRTKPGSKDKPEAESPLEDIVVKLPSGRLLDVPAVFIRPFAAGTMPFPRDDRANGRSALAFKHPSGTLAGVVSESRGVLDGMALALYETGEAATLAQYAQGDLHGNLLTWDEQGLPVLFAQYIKGKESGFLCLFKDGKLALVQENDRGKTTATYVFDGSTIGNTYKADDAVDEHLKSALDELTATKRKLKESEVKVKKSVREVEDKRRKARAAANNVNKRNDSIATTSQMEAADSAALNALRRRALYGGP